ncbi:MAG: hypothetical protein KIT80_23645 [Chitinophagaceae bacterium]|nr:hypothetical protein [Nitrosomonas sp.]MCW5929935.1 hypothetical protein [Chitinophagaceae bacterium]
MKENDVFGEELFKKLTGCNVYDLNSGVPGELYRLFDHGFAADRACVWGGKELEGHEIAIVSRTYCSDDEIDNPPDGLRCVRLSKKYMGSTDIGTAIATVIVKPSEYAEMFLESLIDMPVYMFTCAIPKALHDLGYSISLKLGNERMDSFNDYPSVKIQKIRELRFEVVK